MGDGILHGVVKTSQASGKAPGAGILILSPSDKCSLRFRGRI